MRRAELPILEKFAELSINKGDSESFNLFRTLRDGIKLAINYLGSMGQVWAMKRIKEPVRENQCSQICRLP